MDGPGGDMSPQADQVDDQPRKTQESNSDLIAGLIIRANVLLHDLEAFRERLRALRQDGTVEIANFRGTISAELDMLERLQAKTTATETSVMQVARSSNVPFLEQVWEVALNSHDVVALHKRVYLADAQPDKPLYWHEISVGKSRRERRKGAKDRANAVMVDVISDGGRTWKKVLFATANRLIFDLAKQGWASSGSEDEGCVADEEDAVPMLRITRQLVRASKLVLCRTKHPKVQVILPRIRRGETREVDRVLGDMAACGASLICQNDLYEPPPVAAALHCMSRDPMLDFSASLDIDTTILLALVSDFSHANVLKTPFFHEGLQRQVEVEGHENLLPSCLYPVLGDRKLFCTREAASRMREIVETIGTASEKARTEVLMGDDPSLSGATSLTRFQRLSIHPVPQCLQLPVVIIEHDSYDHRLSDSAKRMLDAMSALNQSVFGYGWATGQTIITSNRGVVKRIETDLERSQDLDESDWPSIWLCPTARSLVGKEKAREPVAEKAMRLPDPLRREHQRRNGLDMLSIKQGAEVADLRPNGYPCEEVLAAKAAATSLETHE